MPKKIIDRTSPKTKLKLVVNSIVRDTQRAKEKEMLDSLKDFNPGGGKLEKY